MAALMRNNGFGDRRVVQLGGAGMCCDDRTTMYGICLTEQPFQRFPTWIWRNTEVVHMAASIAAVLRYLYELNPKATAIARERYGCLIPWQKEPSTYGWAVLSDS